VQALSDTPIPFDIDTVFIGRGLVVVHDVAGCRMVVENATDGAAEARHAEILARRFETMEPRGILETAIVGLVRMAGSSKVAQAAIGAAPAAAPVPEVTPEVLEMQKNANGKRKTRKKVK
jgi:hypothetical protein